MISLTETLTVDEILQQTPADRLRDAISIADAYATRLFVAPGADDLKPPLVGVIRGDLEFLLEVLREFSALPSSPARERMVLASRIDELARHLSYHGDSRQAAAKHQLREIMVALGGAGTPAARG